MSMLRIAFELRADSLKLNNAPPLPVVHRNPNLAHLQSTPEHRVAIAAKRKHREQQLATVANVIVCMGYRASVYVHKCAPFYGPDSEVWSVAHMEELGAAMCSKLTLGVGLLSPFMSSENQQWDLEVSAVINRVTQEMSLQVPHPRTFHVHVLSGESGFTLNQAQSVCQMYALYETVIDELRFVGDLPPAATHTVESVRRNENLRDLSTEELLSVIGRTSSVSELVQLINPPIEADNPIVTENHLYKINLSLLHVERIVFNQHPSTLRGNVIADWGHFVSEFVHSSLSPQSVDILRLEPSLDVLFGDIIHADSLKTAFDPRLA